MALQNTDLFLVVRGGVNYKMSADQIKQFLGTNFIAANIVDRDALIPSLSIGDEVYVVDATGDPTITVGGAKYVWDGTSFLKVAEDESFDVTIAPTNLGYTSSPSQGLVTSSTGTDAILPLVDGTNAGLASPQMFVNSHVPVTTAGTTQTNPINVDANQVLSFNVDALLALP